MSNELVTIRSVKHYFNEFIVEGLKGKEKIQEVDLIEIKEKILKAFKDEVFGQIVFKYGPEVAHMSTDELTERDKAGVQNILQQAFRKWRRLCILCGEHGLGSFFQLEDLQRILENQKSVEIPGFEEDVTDQIGAADNIVVVDEETLKPTEEAISDETAETP